MLMLWTECDFHHPILPPTREAAPTAYPQRTYPAGSATDDAVRNKEIDDTKDKLRETVEPRL
jgi:hypothetical protein